MKFLSCIVLGLILCSFQNEKVAAQSVTKQVIQTSPGDIERLNALIIRVTGEWSAAGYSVLSYYEFVSKKPLDNDIMARFHQNLLRFANKEYGGEHNSFVIYKANSWGIDYELQVVEDTAGQAFPNKYYCADIYTKR